MVREPGRLMRGAAAAPAAAAATAAAAAAADLAWNKPGNPPAGPAPPGVRAPDAPLVALLGAANEGRVEDQAVLGGVALGLERAAQRSGGGGGGGAGRKAAAGEQGWTFGPRPSGGCATRRLCGTRGGLQPRNASFSAKKNSEVRDACSSSRGSSSRERRRPPLAPRREPSRQQGCADACDACSSSRHPPKQRLLRAQDLDGGGRVLGQVCEGAGVADEARTHQLADERAEVGGHGVHLVCTAAERSKGTSGMMHGGERRAR